MRRWPLCLWLLVGYGCSAEIPDTVGVFGEAPTVSVGAAVAAATTPEDSELGGVEVTVRGKVAAVCQSARCWIELRDATGRLHVELAGFRAPPGISGLACRAQGKVLEKDGRPVLIAKGIRFEK